MLRLLTFVQPNHFMRYARQWGRLDPTLPCQEVEHRLAQLASQGRTAQAGLLKLRFHDLRHTIITELAEAGVPDHVMESSSDHLSGRMLELYSLVSVEARREAVYALDTRREAKFEEISSKLRTQ